MSRNFELLQRAASAASATTVSTAVATHVAESDTAISMPARPMALPYAVSAQFQDGEGARKHEVCRLVERAFMFPGAPRAVVFSAADGDYGACDWICATASEVLASNVTGTVCIVDANPRLRSVNVFLGTENHPGLADCIVQNGPITDYAQRLPRENLWLISCGNAAVDWPAALTSERMQMRIAELRAAFDHVLIYAPPVNTYPDAMLLGRMSDGIILVIEANKTKRDSAMRAKETIDSANVRLLGAVLDNRTFPIPDAISRHL